jgi:mannose-1-phosphate guanylyltransferase / mannose-6-phosphate isomerase
MSATVTPVILCGGSGTRLWPVSRASYPKQFGRLIGEQSLFQASVARLPEPDFAPPIIVTAAEFRFIVTEQLGQIGRAPGSMLIEPEGRNTGPAVLASALSIAKTAPDGLMLVCPSDHAVADPQSFQAAVQAGVEAAREGRLVTFGIKPGRPETGYGWLELGQRPDMAAAPAPLPLERFVEKPDAATAQAMLEGGRHLWNSGIFLFSVRAILEAFEAHQPAMLATVRRACDEAVPDLAFLRLDPAAWAETESLSIDYAVMEKASNLAVVPYTGNWSDLGAWDAIAREMGADDARNVLSGPAYAVNCQGSMLRAESPEQVLVGIGLENIVAVAMRDAVLVADIRDGQRVREAVALLKARGAPQADEFPRFHRPWGWYETLSKGTRFQVKRIMVHPGGILSLQSHMHRAEHWVVVSGTARVTVGDQVRLLTENESIYIPLGDVHRLENPGKLDLHLIEVQSGAYLGEDDITRYEDVYARV